MISQQITHISFFSGIGGFEFGASAADIKNIAAIEQDPFCCSVLREWFPKTKIYEQKIETINPNELPTATIYSGGFPCQNISSAGDGKGIYGEKSGAIFAFLDIIRHNRPEFVLLENSNLFNSRGLALVLHKFSTMGYDAEWATLGGDNFGYPHKRKRLFLIAYTNKDGRKSRILRPEKN